MTMSMQWPQLLCADRLGSSRPAGAEPQRSPFQRDSDRIIFSSAFRRLQDKTQVFPLAENDYVRTRLTHSLEVASVARSLGTIVGATICERGELPGIHASDFGAIVSAAALVGTMFVPTGQHRTLASTHVSLSGVAASEPQQMGQVLEDGKFIGISVNTTYLGFRPV